MRAASWVLVLSLSLVPRPAHATCAQVPPRFATLEATESRPLVVQWSLGGACCSGGGGPQSCNTMDAKPGCHALARLDDFGVAVPQPCLELAARPGEPSVLVANRKLAPGAWLLEGNGFVVASEDPQRQPLVLEETGTRSPTVVLGLAAREGAVAVAWGSPGGPLTLRVLDGARDRTFPLGPLTGGRVEVAPFPGGWLVSGGERLVQVARDGAVRSVTVQGSLEALVAQGVVVRGLDGGVSLLGLDARGRLANARPLPDAARWTLLPVDGGLLAAGLNGPYPPLLMKVLGDGRAVPRLQGRWGFAEPRLGTTPGGVMLYDATQRQALDAEGRAVGEPLAGGLNGPRDGLLGLDLDPRFQAAFARAADAPGPRTLVDGLRLAFGEPRVATLDARTLAVAWVSPEGPRLAQVAVAPGVDVGDAGVEVLGSSCTPDVTEQCGLHPFGRDCRRLVCGRAVLEVAVAAGQGRVWGAVLEGERQRAGGRCASVVSWSLDGGVPQAPRVEPCVGSSHAQHVAIAAGERPLVAVEGARGVSVFDVATQRKVLEVRGAREPRLVGGAKKTLLLVEQDFTTIDAHLVGGAVTKLFAAPASAMSAAATPRGFVVMVVKPDETAVARFVDLAGKAGKPVTLQGSSGWLVPGDPVKRVFYLDGGLVEQSFSDLGVPGAPRPQVTPAYPTPVQVGHERFLLTPWSDEHTLELRRLARDGDRVPP